MMAWQRALRRLASSATLGLASSLALLAASPASRAAGANYPVGTASIVIPVPAGFAKPASDASPLHDLGVTMTAASNRFLEIFVSDKDLAAARGGKGAALSRYFLVETLRQTESRDLSVADFGSLKKVLREQSQEYARRATPKAQEQLSSAATSIGKKTSVPDLAIRLGETQIRNVFDETPSSISLLAMTKLSVTANGRQREVPLAIGLTTVLLRGKLVYFYAYSIVDSAADIDWVQAQTKAWLPVAQASNR